MNGKEMLMSIQVPEDAREWMIVPNTPGLCVRGTENLLSICKRTTTDGGRISTLTTIAENLTEDHAVALLQSLWLVCGLQARMNQTEQTATTTPANEAATKSAEQQFQPVTLEEMEKAGLPKSLVDFLRSKGVEVSGYMRL